MDEDLIEDFTNLRVRLDTSRFSVRTLLPDDVQENYLLWFKDPDVRRFISFRPSGDMNELRNFVDQHDKRSDALLLGVFTGFGTHIGNLKYEPIRLWSRSAVLGILVGEPRWRGVGLFSEVFPACNTWFAEKTPIKLLRVGVHTENLAAIKSYRKTGFSVDVGTRTGDHIWMQYFLH